LENCQTAVEAVCGKLKNCGFSWWHRRTKPRDHRSNVTHNLVALKAYGFLT